MADCQRCRELSDEWTHAAATLRGMKRSVIVWEYSAQSRLIEDRYAAYAAHRSSAHADAPAPEGAPQPVGRTKRRPVPRAVRTNIAVAIAVLALLVLLLFVHIV